jgi:acyl-CoA synthetase (AMP-forming)/AMP-acid ligase II
VAVLPRFDPREYLEAVAEHRLSVLGGVPTMFVMLLEQTDLLERLDLSCVGLLTIGSAPLGEALLERLRATFPEARITNNYGTTEVAAVFGNHPEGRPRPPGSIGHPLPAVDVRLVGGDGPDEGVLQVRSPAAMLGYDGNPELTAARLRDGWYDTGDVVRRDADGFFYFVGRNDDMFVCGGENIYPGEVEALLERHPGVREAAVVAVEDDRKGAIPVAFVTVSAPDVGAEAVRAFALANGPAYAHPRRVHVLERLPLNGANKVDKRALQRLAAGDAATRPDPEHHE